MTDVYIVSNLDKLYTYFLYMLQKYTSGFRCSAGIAHNKILAKLVCGMNKPNKQTVLPKHSVNTLYKYVPMECHKSIHS